MGKKYPHGNFRHNSIMHLMGICHGGILQENHDDDEYDDDEVFDEDDDDDDFDDTDDHDDAGV